MIVMNELNEAHRQILAEALQATGGSDPVHDRKGLCLCPDGTICTFAAESPATVVLENLQASAAGMGLNLDHRSDAILFYGLRRAIRRQEEGDTWLPSIAVRFVRKAYYLAVIPVCKGERQGIMEAEASPADLHMRSVTDVPRQILIVIVDWDAFVTILAQRPDTGAWRRWLHSDSVQFEHEPLWLKLLLKVF